MPADTHTLPHLIARSLLLSTKRRKALLNVLPSLTRTQEEVLQKILESGDGILQDIAHHAIERAVEHGDARFLEELDTFLTGSLKNLRKAEEGAERGEEKQNLEHLFDETP